MGHLINTFTSPTNTSLSATVKLHFTSLHCSINSCFVHFTNVHIYYFYIFLLSTSNVFILFTSRLSTLRGTRRDLEQELMVVNKATKILIANKSAKLS